MKNSNLPATKILRSIISKGSHQNHSAIKNVNPLPSPPLWVFLAIMGGYFSTKLKKRTATSEKTTPVNTDASCPSTSSSDVFVAGSDYEVFLSFRGPDTRTGFADYLYTSLIGSGIRAFRDHGELRVGEEIGGNLLKAITQSKICIPIFSKGYASSKWCLKEVAHMVKCKNLLVLPIFYDVTPHQVRHQSDTYKKAFRVHSRRYDETTVQEWRNALAEIGALTGWELQNEANRHEGALVQQVVSKVWRELKKAHLFVGDYITGVEDRVEEVIKLLKVGGDDVRMVVLCGIGGIGKTTLAKIVYNQLSQHFECCSFLKDIRETSLQPKGLEKLQAQLVRDVLKPVNFESEFANTDEGIAVLSERLQGKKVLILLDDVNQKSQVEALAAKGCWFGGGSRIIITCRNTDELDKSQLAGTFEVEGLPSDEALVLFCKHAFRRDSPVADFIDLSKKIVSMMGGLPLALEVIGSLLSGKDAKAWQDIFKKLKNRPHKKVEDKLIISYDALEDSEKQIFLDIACFFIGADWNIAAHMWEHCEFYPHSGIEVLLARSLIKLRDGNKIWMHDQLKDLGREIVCQENPKEPGKRSRLWYSEEARDVLLSQKGTEKIAAMSLDYGFGVKGNSFESKCFNNLLNLRYLRLSNADIVGNFDLHLSKLSWLHWNHCPISFQAYGLHLDNLLVLEISESSITNGWEGWSSMQMAVKLKALILQSCWCLTKTPNLSDFPALETLILENCRELSYVDPSIEKLKNLTFLSLKNCSGLRELPQQLSYLQALVELHIDGCGVRELPTLEGLEKLEVLSASNCMHLCHIPRSIGALMKLTCLSLRGCTSLRKLPDSIGQLASLKELCLSGASVHALPDSIGKLKNLQMLLVDRTRITNLPTTLEMLDKLEVLDASFCSRLSVFETLCPLTTLKLNHTSIEMLPMSISQLSSLETLDLIECHALKNLPQFPNSLQSLSVTCRPIETFPDLSKSTVLMKLQLLLCSELKNIPGLGSLIFLKTLMVSGCSQLAKLDGLEELKCLRKLDIAYCKSLQLLPNLSALKMLSHLSFEECKKLSMVEGLGDLESLEHLKILGCEAIENLPDLSKLGKLKRLFLVRCMRLGELQGLEELKSLEGVDIGYSPSLYHYMEKWPHIPWADLPRVVGIECHMEGVMDLLEFDASDIRMVEIWGMRGVGKTTLAKMIYNQLSGHFAFHSFISNFSEMSMQDGSLEKLRRRLLLDMVGSVNPVQDGSLEMLRRPLLLDRVGYVNPGGFGSVNPVQDGSLEMLRRPLLLDRVGYVNPGGFAPYPTASFLPTGYGVPAFSQSLFNRGLCNRRVLIVLDDVIKKSDLTALVSDQYLLAPGSRILITSRNCDVVEVSQLTRRYELSTMQSSNARVLFCKRAFRSDTSPPDFVTLSERIVSRIGAHPLVLEVIGSYLHGKDETVWDNALERMTKCPLEDIDGLLKISYDALCHEQKQIFLDIACFLIGTDVRIAAHMWEDCGFSSEGGLGELISKSLVEIRNDNTLWMHDLLKDFGRDIVRGESNYNAGKRSRLWFPEARYVFDKQEGTEKIEAICLDYGTGSKDCCAASEKFKSLPNLRFLQLDKANLAGDFNLLLPKLRWLRWYRCPVKLKATNLYLKWLVILDLSESNITDDWNGWSFMQKATNLKVLILKSCQNLEKTPDLSSFPVLERLYLDGCTSLNHLDPSIGNLKKLVFLSVKGCSGLKNQLTQVLSSLDASAELCVDGP